MECKVVEGGDRKKEFMCLVMEGYKKEWKGVSEKGRRKECPGVVEGTEDGMKDAAERGEKIIEVCGWMK